MSGVRRHSIQEEEESSSKSGVVLSDHSSSAAVFRGDDGNDPEINKKDKMLSHPKDASQWQALNFEYP